MKCPNSFLLEGLGRFLFSVNLRIGENIQTIIKMLGISTPFSAIGKDQLVFYLIDLLLGKFLSESFWF